MSRVAGLTITNGVSSGVATLRDCTKYLQ